MREIGRGKEGPLRVLPFFMLGESKYFTLQKQYYCLITHFATALC